MSVEENTVPPQDGGVSAAVIRAMVGFQQEYLGVRRDIKELKETIASQFEVNSIQGRGGKVARRRKPLPIPTVQLHNVLVPDTRRTDLVEMPLLEVGVGLVCFHREMPFAKVLSLFATGFRPKDHPVVISIACALQHLQALNAQCSDVVNNSRVILGVGSIETIADKIIRVPYLDPRHGACMFTIGKDTSWPADAWFAGIVYSIYVKPEYTAPPIHLCVNPVECNESSVAPGEVQIALIPFKVDTNANFEFDDTRMSQNVL